MKTKNLPHTDSIVPISINGMHGRAMHLASTNKARKREILVVYGHHSSLERMHSIAQNISEYGNVYMPDLPGFGGMDSFYKIGKKPTVDNMADYLATFIQLKYKKRQITIIAMSWGFVVTTRMLQKYPSLAEQVELLISVVGFTHKDDFKISSLLFNSVKLTSKALSGPIGSKIVRHTILLAPVLKTIYRVQAKKHPKMKDADKQELQKRLNFEVTLWQSNDVRTYMYTNNVMLTLDLTKQTVRLPLVHIETSNDQYFDNDIVNTHLKMVFASLTTATAHMPNHAPTVVDDIKEAGAILPSSVRKMLAKKP